MKVILTQDVAKLGHRFDVVNVPDGYGINKLIPQGLAKPATPENLKAVKAQAERTASDREASAAQFAESVKALTDKVIDVKVETNEEGKLYQALKAEDIVEAVKQEVGVVIPAAQLHIKSPIKHTGEHTVELASGSNVGSFIVNVITK